MKRKNPVCNQHRGVAKHLQGLARLSCALTPTQVISRAVTVLMDERKSRRALEAVLWAVQQQIKLRPQVLHSLSLKWLSAAWSLA